MWYLNQEGNASGKREGRGDDWGEVRRRSERTAVADGFWGVFLSLGHGTGNLQWGPIGTAGKGVLFPGNTPERKSACAAEAAMVYLGVGHAREPGGAGTPRYA